MCIGWVELAVKKVNWTRKWWNSENRQIRRFCRFYSRRQIIVYRRKRRCKQKCAFSRSNWLNHSERTWQLKSVHSRARIVWIWNFPFCSLPFSHVSVVCMNVRVRHHHRNEIHAQLFLVAVSHALMWCRLFHSHLHSCHVQIEHCPSPGLYGTMRSCDSMNVFVLCLWFRRTGAGMFL